MIEYTIVISEHVCRGDDEQIPPLFNVVRLFLSRDRPFCFYCHRRYMWSTTLNSWDRVADAKMWVPPQDEPYPKGIHHRRSNHPHD